MTQIKQIQGGDVGETTRRCPNYLRKKGAKGGVNVNFGI